ncbi:MAG: hypothetical protein SAK29_19855 [Scytonema sp. PMC 1069.18]|nr:hypothetical protein [Scytonema sp. PMC 1069.18]MEC4885324.1 hypothetical protein [Scytonema sp. PMC 1070.18]
MLLDNKPLVWLHGEVKTPPFSPGYSIELLIRAMLATGATLQEIGQVIASTDRYCQHHPYHCALTQSLEHRYSHPTQPGNFYLDATKNQSLRATETGFFSITS